MEKIGPLSQFLKTQLEKIGAILELEIQTWLEQYLSDPNCVIEVLDALAGRKYRQLKSDIEFLSEADKNLRKQMELQGQNLANYYLLEFKRFIHDHQLYESVEEMTYNQDYINNRIQPIKILSKTETEIGEEFINICRWVTVYELIGNPLFAARDKTGSITPIKAFEVSKLILDAAASSFGIPLTPATKGTVDLIRGILQLARLTKGEGTEETSSVAVETKLNYAYEMEKQLKKLRGEIDNAINNGDFEQIKKLVKKELATRSRTALGQSLPYLDMLFFYELEKFQTMYKQIIEEIFNEHDQSISDGNKEIREIILRLNRATVIEASEMINVLDQLRNHFN